MMKKREWLCLLMLICSSWVQAQVSFPTVSGSVSELTDDGQENPLVGVNIYWSETTKGTTSDKNGRFLIEPVPETNRLVFSYVGYQNDTVQVVAGKPVAVVLHASVELAEVAVVSRQKSTSMSLLGAVKVVHIGETELLKAACCNLSESFETNPSIDVSFTDAVTGTRQIQMLGLAGPYVQMTRENIPDLRGLASVYGLTFTPGSWIESMQMNKGTGSVVNGYESIAGQINVELRKPEDAERLYLNLFANTESRLEANLNLAHRFKNSKWASALLLHGKDNSKRFDHNGDGFMDMPVGQTFTLINRWKYIGDDGIRLQFGAKGTWVNNTGGQMIFRPRDAGTSNAWGMLMDIERMEGWAKVGKVFHDQPWKSMGLQLFGVNHRQDSYWGLNRYDARQQSFYGNYIYQSMIGSSSHQFKTGIGFQYDDFHEYLNDTVFSWKESVPGAFFEYSWLPDHHFSFVAGLRADHHNLFGWFLTPRVHVRYAPAERTVLRLSAGKGQRTASLLSENSGMLASSRQIVFQGTRPGKPYGFDPEVAWNAGLNLVQKFTIDYRDGSIGLDFYRTSFSKQVIQDLDQSPQKAIFYQLNGDSYANSFQAQLDYELLKRLDVRLAYRWYDVKIDYREGRREKPLLARHRSFLNVAYETRNHWKFDYTLNRQGRKRIPITVSNPVEYQLRDYSSAFFLMNAQISKVWKERFELYVGVENLTNYKQHNPILASEQPFGPYFDSSLIWGPVFGRKTYFGLRYKIF